MKNINNIELWIDVPGYENLYKVSSYGRIYSEFKNKLLKPENVNGYLRVTLCKNKSEHKRFFVHRIVASAFLDNPMNLPFINHKNQLRTDNNVSNLEWCDSVYNNNYADRTIKAAKSKSLPILQFDLHDKLIQEWSSAKEAEIELGISRGRICNVCKGKRSTAGGYKWKYKNKTV